MVKLIIFLEDLTIMKKTISQIEQEIRDLVNDYPKREQIEQVSGSWGMLVSSLDIIGDTEQSFDSYNILPEPKTNGEKYLIIYGVLQSLFIQQDAVSNLFAALGMDYTVSPHLKTIREIRNHSSGHPTEVKRKKKHAYEFRIFNHILRLSMTIRMFKLGMFDESGKLTSLDINLPKLVEEQRDVLGSELLFVLETLRNQLNDYRKSHRSTAISDFLPADLTATINKIQLVIDGKAPAAAADALAEAKLMKDGIVSFIDELNARQIQNRNPLVGDDLTKTENLLAAMQEHWEDPSKSPATKAELTELNEKIREMMNSICGYAGELDEEYANDV